LINSLFEFVMNNKAQVFSKTGTFKMGDTV